MSQTAKKQVGTNLTEGPIFRNLLIFAMPIVLTTLLQQFYSMVDLMVAGQFVGSIGTVGVSIGGELADLLAPVAMSFATAGQIYIAQLFGAKDLKRTKETIGTLLTVMMGFSIFGMLLIFVLREPLLHWLNCPPEAWNQAMSYLIITTFGLPFVFGYNAVVGILRGMGESKRPLYFIMVATVVNIVADIILVAVFRLEAAGTALATIASQFGSFAAAFYYMYKHREHFDFELKLSYFKMHSHHLKVIVKLAIPQIVRSSFVRFSMLWVNSHINAYGLVVSATNSVGNKISKFLEAFVAGIDTAAGAMIGQNLGARQHQRAGRIVWVTLACCLSIATVCSALGLFFPKQIFSMFTTDTAVLAMSVVYLQIYVMSFYMSAITGTFQAMVTGCGFVSLGFLIGILDAVVCRIGFSLLFSEVFHLEHLSYWLGTGFSRTLPGLLCFLYFMSGKWKTRKLLSEQK